MEMHRMADDLVDRIVENVTRPQSASNDMGSATQVPIREQIEADRYAKSIAAAANPHRGLRYSKVVPPGSV
jgi:hypothetical protein